MHIVEYFPSGRLSSPLKGPQTLRSSVKTVEEGVAEIRRQFVGDNLTVTGYNEEHDYWWGRTKSPVTRHRILRIEA